jgi:hypothetical protein
MTMWRRRGAALAMASAAIFASTVPAAATSTSRPAVPLLQLAGHTVIHWRGTVAVRIRAARQATFPDNGGVRLISHGHYAFIRIDYVTACRNDVAHCATGMIDWTPAISDGVYGKGYAAHHGGAGTDIIYALGDPQALSGDTIFYLASDGESTLELTTPDLPGRRDVRLTYHAPITVQRLPVNCNSPAGAACDSHSGYQSRLIFGGATHDVGKSGIAEAVVINAEGSDQTRDLAGVPNYQPLGVDGCVYGPGMTISEDPNAADHPTGCDVAGKSAGETGAVEAGEFTFTTANPVVSGQGFWRGDAHRSGPTYLGFMMDRPLDLPNPKWQEAWGIWITYLTP